MARAKRSSIVLSLRVLLFAESALLLPQASAQAIDSGAAVATAAGGNGGTASGSANGVGTIATFNRPVGVALSVNASFALVVSSAVFFIMLKRERDGCVFRFRRLRLRKYQRCSRGGGMGLNAPVPRRFRCG